ncbi:LodA/GoxA family CTQ-dependent oxidase [Streptomyces sp. NPDC001880]
MGFFVGPESADRKPEQPGFYKDEAGAIKRQAACFRLYGYNAAGQVVRELKLNEGGVSEVEWTVHLANKKAAWYQFHVPLDIDEGKKLAPELYGRRNSGVVGADRKKLVNDPGSRTVLGSRAETKKFDSGKIMDKKVYLGEISAQPDGRLLVLGGMGTSKSYANQEATVVANNDTWYDDTSDGPVTAKVTLNGNTLTATPAWVVVDPPDYAPSHVRLRAEPHGFTPSAVPRRAPAHSTHLDRVHGDGWIAAGDAAVAFDPLSSQGILTALYTGRAPASRGRPAARGGDSPGRLRGQSARDARRIPPRSPDHPRPGIPLGPLRLLGPSADRPGCGTHCRHGASVTGEPTDHTTG